MICWSLFKQMSFCAKGQIGLKSYPLYWRTSSGNTPMVLIEREQSGFTQTYTNANLSENCLNKEREDVPNPCAYSKKKW